MKVPLTQQASNKESQLLLCHAAWINGPLSEPSSLQASIETSSEVVFSAKSLSDVERKCSS